MNIIYLSLSTQYTGVEGTVFRKYTVFEIVKLMKKKIGWGYKSKVGFKRWLSYKSRDNLQSVQLLHDGQMSEWWFTLS